ncbi:hypothetical protein LTR53_002364 [Teratosphaeriaceae sp. CCFEE 6253]|nr:hypothetical protein LTR53_002364 [Teratosphaeriaceae sp. CCFEE 6253]
MAMHALATHHTHTRRGSTTSSPPSYDDAEHTQPPPYTQYPANLVPGYPAPPPRAARAPFPTRRSWAVRTQTAYVQEVQELFEEEMGRPASALESGRGMEVSVRGGVRSGRVRRSGGLGAGARMGRGVWYALAAVMGVFMVGMLGVGFGLRNGHQGARA